MRFGSGGSRPSTAVRASKSPFGPAKVSKILLDFDRDGAFDYLDEKNKKFEL